MSPPLTLGLTGWLVAKFRRGRFVFNIQDVAEDVLAEIVVYEISSNENQALIFRGNSIATKAMETYVKMVGEKYLEDTLRSTLSDLLASDLDLEVDPVKVASNEVLHSHRQDLRNVVTIIWKRIANSHSIFPAAATRGYACNRSVHVSLRSL